MSQMHRLSVEHKSSDHGLCVQSRNPSLHRVHQRSFVEDGVVLEIQASFESSSWRGLWWNVRMAWPLWIMRGEEKTMLPHTLRCAFNSIFGCQSISAQAGAFNLNCFFQDPRLPDDWVGDWKSHLGWCASRETCLGWPGQQWKLKHWTQI